MGVSVASTWLGGLFLDYPSHSATRYIYSRGLIKALEEWGGCSHHVENYLEVVIDI